MVMGRLLGSALIVACVVLNSLDALGAERTRLRHVTSIYFDEKGAGIKNPEGVACNDASTLIVADTGNGRLLRYTVDGRSVKPAGENRTPQVTYPLRVQMNSKGDIFALDGKQRRIARFGTG